VRRRDSRCVTETAHEKRAAAEAAAALVEDGMTVGLGTGSTVHYLLPAIAARGITVRCVATSPRTELKARDLGIDVEPFEGLGGPLDIAIDGADQIAPDGWLIKGGGGAHTREKIVAAAAERFVVIASSNKVVDRLSAPVPLELLEYGLPMTLRAVAPTRVRGGPHSPDGGVIADFEGEVGDPAALAAHLAATSGVVEHGLFEPALVADILIAHDGAVEHRRLREPRLS
jgi:ribose 5-phosphate isomerase A